jgi:hypothetical protein
MKRVYKFITEKLASQLQIEEPRVKKPAALCCAFKLALNV